MDEAQRLREWRAANPERDRAHRDAENAKRREARAEASRARKAQHASMAVHLPGPASFVPGRGWVTDAAVRPAVPAKAKAGRRPKDARP
jgi:hypothetical protein